MKCDANSPSVTGREFLSIATPLEQCSFDWCQPHMTRYRRGATAAGLDEVIGLTTIARRVTDWSPSRRVPAQAGWRAPLPDGEEASGSAAPGWPGGRLGYLRMQTVSTPARAVSRHPRSNAVFAAIVAGIETSRARAPGLNHDHAAARSAGISGAETSAVSSSGGARPQDRRRRRESRLVTCRTSRRCILVVGPPRHVGPRRAPRRLAILMARRHSGARESEPGRLTGSDARARHPRQPARSVIIAGTRSGVDRVAVCDSGAGTS